MLKTIMVLVVLALAAGAAPAASVGGSPLMKVPAHHCVIATPVLKQPSDTIRTSAKCSNGKQTFTGVLSYTYQQRDYGGAPCGQPVSKQAPSFVPKLGGTFTVDVTFKAQAPAWVKQNRPKPATKSFSFTLGHWQTQCGKLDLADLPYPGQLCDYEFPAGGDPCGSFLSDDNYNQAHQSSPLPQQGTTPLLIGNTVYAPALLSSGGRCTEENHPSKYFLMGKRLVYASFHCGNVLVVQLLTIYYYPPGSSSLCIGPRTWPNDQYVQGQHNLPNDGYGYFTLPDDWQQWGGRLGVVFEELVYPPGQEQTFLKDGNLYMPNREYASLTRDLGGSRNACAELGQLKS